jgi:hypothetical protein
MGDNRACRGEPPVKIREERAAMTVHKRGELPVKFKFKVGGTSVERERET